VVYSDSTAICTQTTAAEDVDIELLQSHRLDYLYITHPFGLVFSVTMGPPEDDVKLGMLEREARAFTPPNSLAGESRNA
jgi:hypothetical protein